MSGPRPPSLTRKWLTRFALQIVMRMFRGKIGRFRQRPRISMHNYYNFLHV
jgi:hypothetical protein